MVDLEESLRIRDELLKSGAAPPRFSSGGGGRRPRAAPILPFLEDYEEWFGTITVGPPLFFEDYEVGWP